MTKLIISTVGTSIFTNLADDQERRLIIKYSNSKENAAPPELKKIIQDISARLRNKFTSASNPERRRISAELNGILGIYNDNLRNRERDFHYLISTDTFPGKQAAALLLSLLRNQGLNGDTYTPHNLSTSDKLSFSEGIKDLLKFCQNIIPQYKAGKYDVIFNLTGSFKSLQGYLNTIAMFYADKIVYIFESPLSELIEIPRLPISIDEEPFVKNKDLLLLLSKGKIVTKNELKDFPETMYDEIENNVVLSIWGDLIFEKLKERLYSELPILPRISYTETFKKDFKGIMEQKAKMRLVEALAKAAVILDENNGSTEKLKTDGGLLYEDYAAKSDIGINIGHFRISQGIRVSCQSINGILHLRKYGAEPVVNSNP